MGRKDFRLIPDVPVAELLLDVSNPRIRSGLDQNDCVARILKKEEQLINLAKNIQEEGLSTAAILVLESTDGKLTVMDGNRRVTALKLLNNPALCNSDRLQKIFANIRAKSASNIPASVDCLATQDEEAVIKEILLRHSGGRNGIGQVDWTTYLRTSFMLQHNQSDPNRRTGQYLLWAEEKGVLIDDEFPVTNLVRFLTESNLKALGFAIKNDELTPEFSEEICQKMASKIIYDFGFGGKTVDDIRRIEQQNAYIQEVRQQAGVVEGSSKDEPNGPGGGNGGDGKSPEHKADGGDSPKSPDGGLGGPNSGGVKEPDEKLSEGDSKANPGGPNDQKPPNPGTRPKPAWDRPRLFHRAIYPGKIPDEHTKAKSVVADLCKLETEKTPLAVAFLLRALVEMSERNYREKNGLPEKDGLRRNILQAATHMKANNLLTADQFEVVDRRSNTANDMLNIQTLQNFLHKASFHTDRHWLHTFWDDVRPFVVECWNS
jgi:hypothetical protein